MTRKGVAALLVAAGVAGASYAARSLGAQGRPPSLARESGRAGFDAPDVPDARLGGGPPAPGPGRSALAEIERLIAAYESRVAEAPNALELTFLGRLYVERGRISGDVATYAQAEEALERSLGISPAEPETQTLLATVRYTTHDFLGALALAEGILETDPSALGALAVAADAGLELGRYDEAGESYATLARRLPGVAAVEARAARLAFLLGDVGEARARAAAAARAARREGASGPSLAWYLSLRAQIELDGGAYGRAAALSARAARLAPSYHLAVAGLARARAAQDRTGEAIRLFRRAVRLLPDPAYLASLGDLHALSGEPERARRAYDTVEVVATLARVNRQVFNRRLALFYADHDVAPGEARRLAGRELAVRRDVYGYDAYAWALYRNGRFEEARAASDRALALGTRDAMLLYHAGLISAALGEDARAESELRQTLAISPVFDPLQAAHAREVLAGLEGAA